MKPDVATDFKYLIIGRVCKTFKCSPHFLLSQLCNKTCHWLSWVFALECSCIQSPVYRAACFTVMQPALLAQHKTPPLSSVPHPLHTNVSMEAFSCHSKPSCMKNIDIEFSQLGMWQGSFASVCWFFTDNNTIDHPADGDAWMSGSNILCFLLLELLCPC